MLNICQLFKEGVLKGATKPCLCCYTGYIQSRLTLRRSDQVTLEFCPALATQYTINHMNTASNYRSISFQSSATD